MQILHLQDGSHLDIFTALLEGIIPGGVVVALRKPIASEAPRRRGHWQGGRWASRKESLVGWDYTGKTNKHFQSGGLIYNKNIPLADPVGELPNCVRPIMSAGPALCRGCDKIKQLEATFGTRWRLKSRPDFRRFRIQCVPTDTL